MASLLYAGDVGVKQLGDPPTVEGAHWMRGVVTIAAYRDHYGVTSSPPLGGLPSTDIQSVDRARAEAALHRVKDDLANSTARRLESSYSRLGR